MNINMILFQIICIIPNIYEFKRILNLFENMHTAGLYAHCRTAGQPHTATRTAAQPHTAAHTATHRCTLHELKCRTPHTARRTPQCCRTPQST
jgi:hypothetical protein